MISSKQKESSSELKESSSRLKGSSEFKESSSELKEGSWDFPQPNPEEFHCSSTGYLMQWPQNLYITVIAPPHPKGGTQLYIVKI